MRSPGKALPTPKRSSKPPASPPLNSTYEPSPGSGDVRPRIIASIADSFVTVFKERSISELGRYEKALAAYELALRLDPDDALAYNGKGNALDDLNRYEEALVAYEQAIIQDPDYA